MFHQRFSIPFESGHIPRPLLMLMLLCLPSPSTFDAFAKSVDDVPQAGFIRDLLSQLLDYFVQLRTTFLELPIALGACVLLECHTPPHKGARASWRRRSHT